MATIVIKHVFTVCDISGQMTVELQTKFLCHYPMLERATLEKNKKVQSKHSNHGDGDNRLNIAILKLGPNETDPHRLLFVRRQ